MGHFLRLSCVVYIVLLLSAVGVYAVVSVPTVVPMQDTLTMNLTEISKIIITVRNTDPLPQKINVKLESAVANAPIGNWIWFDGHRYDASRTSLDFLFEPYGQKLIVFNVMGGILTGGSETINIEAISDGGSDIGTVKVEIVEKQGVFYNKVPGAVTWAILLVLVIALLGDLLKGRLSTSL